ncbi:MAG: hypothetical protein DPW18_19775 [Chloroflexi bacterium]|nr:MAG: hypothetical protein EDM79_19685 [Chloroflexota bacterium]MCQ3939258.1 hypothetical protein [Chloroflexota bacterium]MDL1945013.1 hypothetical protein [Chloroflexi bacterium CFX2]
MKGPIWKVFVAAGFMMGLLVGCASAPASTPLSASTSTPLPASTPENTATPAPTATLTPIPIAGIDEPIIVNEVNVQVLEAKWEEPQVVIGYQPKAGCRSLMITFRLQSAATNSPAGLMNRIEFRQMRVVDDQGNESPVVFFNLPISSLTGSEYAQLDLFFSVLENTTPQTLRFVDGQMIELAPLLESVYSNGSFVLFEPTAAL